MRVSWSHSHKPTMAAVPSSRSSERVVGDTRVMDIYSEYAETVTANEAPSKIKARLSALFVFSESQGLTGQAAFDGLRSLYSKLQAELMDTRNFSVFYGFVFFMCREQGQKSIPVGMATIAWRLALTRRFRLLDEWCAFVQVHQRHAISEDTWRQVLEFSRSVHEDLSNYDPEGAWPVLVDEFVDNMYRKNTLSRRSKDPVRACNGRIDAVPMSNTDHSSASSLNCRVSTLPGMTAQAGSKRRWKCPIEEVAQTESVSCLSQRLAKMSSPLGTKRMRTSGISLLEVSDPMEFVNGSEQEEQGGFEQRDRANVLNQIAQGSIMIQDPPPFTGVRDYDVFLSPWRPWPTQGTIENRRWGQSHGSPNVQRAEIAIGCGGYPAFLSPQQDLLLHQ